MFTPGVDQFPPEGWLATIIPPDSPGYGPPVETMAPPDPANVGLDPRLMTHQRMLDLVGDKMIRFKVLRQPDDLGGAAHRASLDLYIDCAECGRGITAARPTSPVQLAADVLRHYVSAHDMPLSGASPGAASQGVSTDGA